MAHRNAVSVLPLPVGALTRTCSPLAMAGQARSCASVGAANRPSNHLRTSGWKSCKARSDMRLAYAIAVWIHSVCAWSCRDGQSADVVSPRWYYTRAVVASSDLCPSCGRPVRSARRCPCGASGTAGLPGANATWDVPALDRSVERRFRQFALPVALLCAWGLVHTGLPHMLLRTVFSMWIHELGHAAAAWLCGRWAFPGPWFTPVAAEPSWLLAAVVATGLGYAVYRWRRSALLAIPVGLLLAQLVCTLLLSERAVRSFIVWSGDGGCMVFGTLLMLSFYAARDSQIRVGWLRWGFLVIGAAAFADGFSTWWAARADRDAIPFGENEGQGLSDPTVLVFEQQFSIPGLVHGYLVLGFACLAVLVGAYVWGLRRESDPGVGS